MLGGKIWVESEENIGSIFYFTIEDVVDMKPPETLQTEKPIIIKSDLDNKTILVAEDDPVSIILIKRILKLEKYNYVLAENGLEVLSLLKANSNIDLVLLDIKMPVMDGVEATEQIRKFNKKIPIIAQTAFALEGDKERINEAGCDYFIPKPIVRSELIRVIRKYIS